MLHVQPTHVNHNGLVLQVIETDSGPPAPTCFSRITLPLSSNNTSCSLFIITLCTCTQSKVIGSVIVIVVIVVVVNENITKSQHLGTLATRKYDKSVEFGKKLASLCFESSGTAYKHHK